VPLSEVNEDETRGWLVVNKAHYRDKKDLDVIRAQTRERVRSFRDRNAEKRDVTPVTQGNAKKRHTDTDTDTTAVGRAERSGRLGSNRERDVSEGGGAWFAGKTRREHGGIPRPYPHEAHVMTLNVRNVFLAGISEPVQPDLLCRAPRTGTQKHKLLLAFQRGESLTTLEAALKYGVMALSQRCGELIRMGWPIQSETVETDGGAHVSRYWMRR
jgi:hypothetical protein